MTFNPSDDPEVLVSIIDSCIQFCDFIVAGEEIAIALKYDEENMFAPMIVLLEKNDPANILLAAADKLGVPVIKNNSLAKNLCSYGKQGQAIPEACFRDVSLALARVGRFQRRGRPNRKNRQGIPIRIPRPLSLELGASLFALIGEGAGRKKLLAEPLNVMRKKVMRLLGITIPFFKVSDSRKLNADEYRILFKGLEAGRGKVELGWYAGEAGVIPDMMNNPESIRAVAKAAALVPLRHASLILQRRVPELLGRDEVEAILDAAEEKYPVVTGEVKSLLSLGIVREILQSLVSEQVSIRHIAIILETLADWGSFGPVPNDLIVEQIRQSLKRQICLEYADDRLTLRVLTLETKLEKKFLDHLPDSSVGVDWADAISGAVLGMEERGYPPVILCSPKVRSPLKEATRKKLPELAVLSYLEIPSDMNVEPVGEIRFEESARFPGVGH